MGHTEIYDRQYHEDKGLQGDNQNMEYRPTYLQQSCGHEPNDTSAEQCRNQDKNHLAGIHVAEQSQTKGEGLGEQAYNFHKQVYGDK